MARKTLVVSNVEVYPGYMACDSSAMGEMFCTWFLGYGRGVPLGVFNLDCLAFDDETRLEKIAQLSLTVTPIPFSKLSIRHSCCFLRGSSLRVSGSLIVAKFFCPSMTFLGDPNFHKNPRGHWGA